MRFRSLILSALLFSVLQACGGSSPSSPSTNVNAPAQLSPANGAVLANTSQPITLRVTNATVTGSAAVTYTFEVASDNAFATIVATRSVAADPSGQTSTTLDPLTAGRAYFWRVKTTIGNTSSPYSGTSSFSVGSAVTIQAPVPVAPRTGTTEPSQRPTFVVTNATRSGGAGPISYRFEVSGTSAFATLITSATVSEGAGETTFTPSTDLPAETTVYWRVQAFDATNNASSAYSTPQSVTTTLSIDLRTVNYQRFVNVSSWPETDRIIAVEQDGAGNGDMCISHTKRGLWPEADFLGDPSVTVEATQWYFARINGQWYAGAGEWLRPGQICKTGQTTEQIGPDGTWGGPMDTWAPKAGELVGYMVTTPARDWPNFKTLDERSDIVLVPWKDSRVK
jgi:hypothetical protein